jgi:pSer/pThr/pTyr-binding forkhead associated (FHA) protein
MNDQTTLNQGAAPFEPLRLRLHPGGYVIDLTAPDLVLGRHSEADLRMPMPDVSRRHCRFVHSGGAWELIDLGSLNGVYVNGARVERATLHTGDNIRICGVEFEVTSADGTPPVASPNQVILGMVQAIASSARKAS